MTNEVSIRCQKHQRLVYGVYGVYPQYTPGPNVTCHLAMKTTYCLRTYHFEEYGSRRILTEFKKTAKEKDWVLEQKVGKQEIHSKGMKTADRSARVAEENVTTDHCR